MNDSTVQLTVRGVDSRTKQQLSKMAARKGVSLNNLLVKALKQTAGTNTVEERMRHFQKAIHQQQISSRDIAKAEVAIAEMDVTSKAKQQRDAHDISF